MKQIALATGGFDPLHGGHIKYLKAASMLGGKLIVGVNSDDWLSRKKGRPFMPWKERAAIIRELSFVDEVIAFDDSDNSAIDAIQKVLDTYKDSKVIFCNGGDRTKTNIPEMTLENIDFEFSVGGDNKENSSSWILEEWKAPKVKRDWGYYRIIHDPSTNTKVKELVVEPGKKLSMQRHKERSERWFIDEGIATVYTLDSSSDVELMGVYKRHQSLHIPVNTWHQLSNETNALCKLIEIQYGKNCIEDDIERKYYAQN